MFDYIVNKIVKKYNISNFNTFFVFGMDNENISLLKKFHRFVFENSLKLSFWGLVVFFDFILKLRICFGKINRRLGKVNKIANNKCHSKTLIIPKNTPIVKSKNVNL